MMASLNSAAKPVVSDLLTNKAMKGESSSLMSLISHVGTAHGVQPVVHFDYNKTQ